MPEHTHLVVGRHRFKVEHVANQLKGAASRKLVDEGLHPLLPFRKSGKRIPCMWAERRWKVYLDSDDAIENAINYVIENPIKEGKPRQRWSWITPYTGISPGVSYV